MLNSVAEQRRERQQQEWNAKHGEHREAKIAGDMTQRRPVGGDLIGIGEQPAKGHLQVCRRWRGEHHDDECAARDHEPGRDFETLDDVAALDGLIQPSRRRVFAMLGVVALLGHCDCLARRPCHACGASSCSTPPA